MQFKDMRPKPLNVSQDTDRITLTQKHTHTHTNYLLSMASSADPGVPFARYALLLCSEQGCNSVLCLRAAMKATKLIRLPSGGQDDSLMTLAGQLSIHTL